MNIFDQLFFNSFNYYKKGSHKKKANTVALYYISLVQISLVLVLGVFFSEFFYQMHVHTMDASKAWILFIIISILLYFMNWIKYSGKKRKVMNAKQQKNTNFGIITLWLIPVVSTFLSVILLKVL